MTQIAILPSLTATDQTQIFGYANLNLDLEESEDQSDDNTLAASNDQAISGTTISAFHFGINEVKRLAKDGVTISNNSGDNSLYLLKGNVLLTPDRNFTVDTDLGKIHIKSGATVFIMKAHNNVIVYDVMQTKPNLLSIAVNGHRLEIEPGNMLSLTRENMDNSPKIVADNSIILHGSSQPIRLNGGIKAFSANFSVKSALANIEPLRRFGFFQLQRRQTHVRKTLEECSNSRRFQWWC